MSWFATNVTDSLLMPPLSILIFLLLGLLFLPRYSKLTKPVLLSIIVVFWVACTPYFTEGSLHILESQTTPLTPQMKKADAIVILGGGTYFHAPEYAGIDSIAETTLCRLRYGARLQRETGKPILVSGGRPRHNLISESSLMSSVLTQEFNVPVKWSEGESNNTYENAVYSYRILQKVGINKIYLVTHASHMPRASAIFRKVGFDVIEAPTAFTTRPETNLLTFLPRSEALQEIKIFTHEVVGILWYSLKFMLI